MIAVIGRPRDRLAQAVLERWRDREAALLSVRDLSRTGWRHDPFAPGDGVAVVDGRRVAVDEIAAVVTTIDGISSYELPHIVREDREYVAAEMHAFLVAWLTTIPCPLLNRPTPRSLAGCGWHREQWILAATELGIPAVPMHEPSDAPEEREAGSTVTLVGDVVLGAPDVRVAGWIRGLAARAGTATLAARFTTGDPPRFVAAGCLPDLTRPEVAAAALGWLERGGA